ncbi:MAG TPA: ABC transporter ATP-binding protein [Jiangellaceae bacterium]
MLKVEALDAGYGGLQILEDLSLEVPDGKIVALLGANGAGKTTTLRAISGLIRPLRGSIIFDGHELAGKSPHDIVRAGVVQVPEGRELFGTLTVEENLRMGAFARPRAEIEAARAQVEEIFPVLGDRRTQIAATLSGGQQQMLAIGRALMVGPRVLMLDEPSFGLAPKLVAQVFTTVETVRDAGITVLLVEQNATHALRLADRAYVLESGRVVLEGAGVELLEDDRVRTAYLGT